MLRKITSRAGTLIALAVFTSLLALLIALSASRPGRLNPFKWLLVAALAVNAFSQCLRWSRKRRSIQDQPITRLNLEGKS